MTEEGSGMTVVKVGPLSTRMPGTDECTENGLTMKTEVMVSP